MDVTEQPHENRQERRLRANLAVTLEFGGRQEGCWAEDLSVGGMRLRIDPAAVQIGQAVEAVFHLPVQADAVRGPAEVIWQRRDQAGIRFIKRESELHTRLDAYLRSRKTAPWYL